MSNESENSQPAAPQSAPERQTTQQYPYAGAQAPEQLPPPQHQQQQQQQPYSYGAQASGHGDRGQLPPFNIMALVAFIGAFVIPVVGIVCGHITLREYRRGLPERGREYALAGLILGYIFTALWVVLAVVWVVFAFTHFGHTGGSISHTGNGFGRFGGGGLGRGGAGGGTGGGFSTPAPTPGS